MELILASCVLRYSFLAWLPRNTLLLPYRIPAGTILDPSLCHIVDTNPSLLLPTVTDGTSTWSAGGSVSGTRGETWGWAGDLGNTLLKVEALLPSVPLSLVFSIHEILWTLSLWPLHWSRRHTYSYILFRLKVTSKSPTLFNLSKPNLA
jgi:hypothetical protein